MAKISPIANRVGQQVELIQELDKLFGKQLRKLHPTAYQLLAHTIDENPPMLDKIAEMSVSERKLLLTLAHGCILEALPELGTMGMSRRGQGHPFLRRNEPFLCLIPDYRPPRGIGMGIGIRTRDGNWEIEYGEKLSHRQLQQLYPGVQFFTWDTVIDSLWRERVQAS